MSTRLSGDAIIYYQRLMSSCGFYDGAIDGEWGPRTAAADAAFHGESDKLKAIGTFDDRTEKNIATLHIKAQEMARLFMAKATQHTKTVRIISGNRTYEEQNKLYAQGRFGNPPPVVTNARGGQSNHNFGIAWDIGVFDADGRYLQGGNAAEDAEYRQVFQLASGVGVEWGGQWTSIVDLPHYQVPTGMKTSQVRALFEAGQPYT